ncbi:MAG: NAD-binding protein [Chloroflexi bacterium]|nr:NAD-binding protein [Chloroflexota bacterium]
MYIIMVGGGKVGYHLGKALMNAGHEVFLIERDARKVENIVDAFGNIALKGDGSEPSILREAGAARTDVLIAVTGNDEDNLAACQLAKHHFKVGRTIALVNNPQNEPLFRLLGVDVAVASTQIILAEIEEELPARPPIHVLPVRGNREFIGVEIPADSAVVGQTLGEVELPPDTQVSAIINREGHLKPVSENTLLEAYDELVALTTADSAEALLEALTREA